jgi:hypothetical protein
MNTFLSFQQAWRETPEPGFQPGRVWVESRHRCLFVRAELMDLDIFNPDMRFNEPFFLKGDTFEVFIQPPGQDAYFEFHVGPDNQGLQLRIPSREEFSRSREVLIPESWKIRDWRMITSTEVEHKLNRWKVSLKLPLNRLLEGTEALRAGDWRLSFGRYDYNQSTSVPVLSSTSPHPVCNFHRLEEWAAIPI